MSTYERLTRLQPFDHLLNQSKLNPDNIAIDGPMGPITYRKLYERAKKYSSFLSARGIKQGDLVALRVLNADTVPVLFACWSLGATTAIFPWPLDDESRENFDWLISLENETDFPVTHFIHLSGEARDAVSRESIISEPVEFAPGQPIHAIFSSGTTGKPKGVPFELELLEARAWNARRIWMPELPFFSLIGERMADRILLVMARRAGRHIAGRGRHVIDAELLQFLGALREGCGEENIRRFIDEIARENHTRTNRIA